MKGNQSVLCYFKALCWEEVDLCGPPAISIAGPCHEVINGAGVLSVCSDSSSSTMSRPYNRTAGHRRN